MKNDECLDKEIIDFIKKLYLPENRDLLEALANNMSIPLKYLNPAPFLKKILEQE